jgi:hypothetical protein
MGTPIGIITRLVDAIIRIMQESELGRLILTLLGIAIELGAILFSIGLVFNYFQTRHSRSITNLRSSFMGKILLYGAAVTTVVVLATSIHNYRIEIGTIIAYTIITTLITAIIFALLFGAFSSRLMPLWGTTLGRSGVYLVVAILVIIVTEEFDFSTLSGFDGFNFLIIIATSIIMKYIVDDKFNELKHIMEYRSSNAKGCAKKSYVQYNEEDSWSFR